MFILLLAALLLLLLGWNIYYRRHWYRQVDVTLDFDRTSVYAGEQVELTEVITNRKKLPLPVLVPQLPQTMPPAAQGLADMGRYPRLHIQIQPVRMLLTKLDPILQILLPPLPDAAALLRIGTLIFQFLFHMIDPC